VRTRYQHPILATCRPSGLVFRGGRGPPRSLQSKNAPAALLESWRTRAANIRKRPGDGFFQIKDGAEKRPIQSFARRVRNFW
jgi:hypothetical protein